jgi:hypothetical protein
MRQQLFLLLLLLLLLLLFLPHATYCATAGAGGGRCDRRCGRSFVAPYPFGFSGDCPFLLGCNATASTPLLPRSTAAAPYPVLSFNSTSSTFVVSLAPSCNRTVGDANASLNVAASRAGAGAGYGVSSQTGLFLRGACSGTTAGAFKCSVSADIMGKLLRKTQCGNDTAWTCVGSPPTAAVSKGHGEFLDWDDVEAAGCEDALTATVYGVAPAGLPSLEFGVAELGWWLEGMCNATSGRCAQNATCQDVVTPSGAWGHRCACLHGMSGDGFAAGEGCHYGAGEFLLPSPWLV